MALNWDTRGQGGDALSLTGVTSIARATFVPDFLGDQGQQTAETAGLTDEGRHVGSTDPYCLMPKPHETFRFAGAVNHLDLTGPAYGKVVLVADIDTRMLHLFGAVYPHLLEYFPLKGSAGRPEIFRAVCDGMRDFPFKVENIDTPGMSNPCRVGGAAAYFDGATLFLNDLSARSGRLTRKALELCFSGSPISVAFGEQIDGSDRLLADKGLERLDLELHARTLRAEAMDRSPRRFSPALMAAIKATAAAWELESEAKHRDAHVHGGLARFLEQGPAGMTAPLLADVGERLAEFSFYGAYRNTFDSDGLRVEVLRASLKAVAESLRLEPTERSVIAGAIQSLFTGNPPFRRTFEPPHWNTFILALYGLKVS